MHLAELFDQVLRLASEVGLVRVDIVALDSPDMQANASPGANRRADWVHDEVDRIIKEARTIDEDEDRRLGQASYEDIPEALLDPNTRVASLLAAKCKVPKPRFAARAAHL